jgi:hypothetical protein
MEDNYATYQGASGGGESKLAQMQVLSDEINNTGCMPRKPKLVYC